jgi:hypothetical protein
LKKILDTVKTTKASDIYSDSGKDSGWQRIAWSFLKVTKKKSLYVEELCRPIDVIFYFSVKKVVGADKSLNTEKKIRLQLYYSQTHYHRSVKDDTIPEVSTKTHPMTTDLLLTSWCLFFLIFF